VLGDPSADDQDAMLDAIARALDVLPLSVAGEFHEALTRLNTKRDSGLGTRDERELSVRQSGRKSVDASACGSKAYPADCRP
jgi:hypothetical protein